MMTVSSRGEKPSQRSLWFNMVRGGEGCKPQMQWELEEVIPDPAWYLTEPGKYPGGAPGQKNTEAEP